MEKARAQAERWGVNIDDADMVNEATIQMMDSGKFDHRFMREWETLPKHEKTWEAMKTYFGNEYVSLVRYQSSLKGNMGSINQMTEQPDDAQDREVTQYLEDLRRDALVGNEQIQQMSEAFSGAATTMKEVMERLKASQAEVKKLTDLVATLTKTNATLTENNKQLTSSIKTLTEAIKKGGTAAPGAENKGGGQWKSAAQKSNPDKEGCTICGIPHAKPFVKYCWELEANASKRKPGWKSQLE
jgi:DNA repair exonuclease SbcCD ATPase subunit